MRRLVATLSTLTALLVVTVSSAVAGQPAKRAVGLDDLARIRTVGDPQVSPDGRWIAYTVGTIDAEKDKRDTDLWMAGWDGAQQIRLTATTDSSESTPRWSPDNRYLAFLTSRGDEDAKKRGAQVWLLNRAGGEAQQLTDIKGGVSDLAWSPDGKRLVLVVDDFDPNSDPEKKESWKRKTQPPIVIDRYHFKSDGAGYLTRLYSHLALFDVETRKSEVLTSGVFDDLTPSWSPDGTQIAFVSNRAPDPDRVDDTNVYVIEAKAGAKPRQLTTYPGRDDGRPAWSPDGKWLAYLQGDETKYSAYNQAKLAIIPAAGGAPKVLTAVLDRAMSGPILWSADGQTLRGVVADDRTEYVATVSVRTGAVDKLTSGQRVVSSLSPKGDGALAVIASTATEIGEVHVLENGALRRVTHQNDAWLDELQLATTEGFTCKSKDGTVVNGLMVKPAGFIAGKRYPTLLYIHGGPNGQDEFGFSVERELFAANGYVVLAVNYRGGAGRGSAYQKAIFADWGNKEVMDLLAGVDYAVASGIADPDRLGIGGWSYGGILTDYTIASDGRFKAAVSGASSALQLTMYGIDQYIAQYDNELGPPWTSQETWLKVSYPFFHADRIKTPTLFLCGQVDFNVPIAGVEQMYQALRTLNVDTQLIIYPGQHHGIRMPSYVRDRLTRYLAWWDRYLKK
ncbi:MAG TPA: S9 family peptidase [Vicinamibacterales bacterium]|jgi:dipeptidyl aminopeptidase/acylaminoacyl peptidase